MSATSPRRGAIVTVYAAAVAIGATLLFLIQPMFASRRASATRWRAGGVDDQRPLFSGRPARGVRVRACARSPRVHADPRGDPSARRRRWCALAAARHRLDANVGGWFAAGVAAGRRGHRGAWRAALRRCGDCPIGPALVHGNRSGESRSGVRALCSQQRGQPRWTARVSPDRRTRLHAEHAEPAVAGRLPHAGGQSAGGRRPGVPLSPAGGGSGRDRARGGAGLRHRGRSH